MKRRTIRMMIALLLVAVGWVAGRASTPAPDFTLTIEAPSGRTTVTCVRGCVLQGGRDEGLSGTLTEYGFECKGRMAGPRCGATVNGWLRR